MWGLTYGTAHVDVQEVTLDSLLDQLRHTCHLGRAAPTHLHTKEVLKKKNVVDNRA